MLLRIDKVLGRNNPVDPQPSADPPLHACLATAAVDEGGDGNGGGGGGNTQTQGGSQIIRGVPHAVIPPSPAAEGDGLNRTGEILTVGRKNCAVIIDDRCVSRGHATISLLSTRPPDDEAAAAARALLGDRVVMEFGTPTTPEEIRACETSPSGSICVLKDRGSKFGTFVSVDEGLLREHLQHLPGNDGDAPGGGDETGDETDDEGAAARGSRFNYAQLSEKQILAVQLLADNASFDDATLPKFLKLKPKQSLPLLQLSHSGLESNSSHVIVLFGPQGSAVRLSRLPLHLTFSRIKKPELDVFISALHYVGATHSSQWDVERSTHLVAPDKTAAAKGIMAWACRRPVVTKQYIESLLNRTDPAEVLPKEEDYIPSGSWDRNLRWTAEPSEALKGYRIAVMIDDDNAPLAQSAGAEILVIHKDAPSSQGEFEAWWAAQAQRALDEKMALVVVGSTSKKCKKLYDWLKHDEDVRFTNAKNIAKAITGNKGEGDLLLDTKKVVIKKIDGWDAVVDEKSESEKDHERAAVGLAPKKIAAAVATAAQKNDIQEENPSPPGNQSLKDNEDLTASARNKRGKQEEPAEQLEREEEQRQLKRRKCDQKIPEEYICEQEPPEEAAPSADNFSEREAGADKSTEKRNNKTWKTRDQFRKDDASSDEEPGIPAKRIPLPTTEDGWLVAAPRKRRAYRKERTDAEENIPDSAAETERVSLIVRKYVPSNRAPSNGNRGVGRRGHVKKKDFKRFRKNHVLRGYSSFNPYSGNRNRNQVSSIPTIRLVERMPKESERQRQLQQQQEELEREQELADALFNEVGPKSGRKRGGTLHSYLSQSTTKRSRGRR